MPQFAFKEWAVVCRALAEGKQALILRKGGIAEVGGAFRPDHARFWLFPTFLHQKADGLKPQYSGWLTTEQQFSRELTLTHYVEVPAAYHLLRPDPAADLNDLHIWSVETITQRFHYRTPGLYVLPARVYRAHTPRTIVVKPEYDGCKTWVDLESTPDFAEDAGTPVLSDRDFAGVLEAIETVVNPMGFA
jgi:hypothetical protein